VYFAIDETLVARVYDHIFKHGSSASTRLILIIVLAVITHVLVKGVSLISERVIVLTQQHRDRFHFAAQQPKIVTLIRLIANTTTWTIYFVAMGLFLQECGVNLTAYLASASVIGLAISFGSQGAVRSSSVNTSRLASSLTRAISELSR